LDWRAFQRKAQIKHNTENVYIRSEIQNCILTDQSNTLRSCYYYCYCYYYYFSCA